MRRIVWLAAGVFAFLFAAAPAVMGDVVEEVEGRGLLVRSEPSRATVFINGIERGFTPFTFETIPPGEYGIRLTKEGYGERWIWVRVRENSRLEVTLNMEAILGILSLDIQRKAGSPPPERLPLRPEITVDGELRNNTILSLPVGYRVVRIRAFGWEETVHSVYIQKDFSQALKVEMQAAPFSMTGADLRRSRFNPANSGALGRTEITFNVSAPGMGRIVIENQGGDTVFAQDLGPFATWSQSVAWNGRDGEGMPLPDGPYRALILAESLGAEGSRQVEQRAELIAHIDSSLNIYPLSSTALVSGLFFSPLPETIPPGSFQIDGSLIFGRAPAAGGAWEALPFAAALRFSPGGNFEMTGALNITPYFDKDAASALGGGLKWAFLRSGQGSGLAAAVALSYAWANRGSLTPFGATAGVALSLPLSWRLGEAFSLAVNPGALWTGAGGYPGEAVPRILLSGGLLFRRPVFTAGLSLQSRLALPGGEDPGFGPHMAAAELRFFPPPSNMVFSLLGGGWAEGGEYGGFGGIGIGLIY